MLQKTSLIVALACLCITPHLAAETLSLASWPQWRGPARDGHVVPAQWPATLSEQHLSETWSKPLGPSYSGPVVDGDRVFITETQNSSHEVVRAFRRSTGEELWKTSWQGAMRVPFFAAANGSWIRATPAVDGEFLYVGGIRDVLVCLKADTGKLVWKLDFVAQTGTPLPKFGFVASPLVRDDAVYVQAGASFAKVDKRTGQIIWQTLQDQGGMYGSAFSSPTFAEIDGRTQIVVQTRTHLAGVAPEDGSVLWSESIPAFRGMNILTPTVIGNNVFTSSYGGQSTMFSVRQSTDGWQIEQRWQHRSQAYMSSPVVIGSQIYLHLRNQRLVCLDAETGKAHWTSRPFGKYWSMVANGDRLLALDQTGELFLIDASPNEFRLIDSRQVANDSWAHLAVVGDEIFVRDLGALQRFEWK